MIMKKNNNFKAELINENTKEKIDIKLNYDIKEIFKFNEYNAEIKFNFNEYNAAINYSEDAAKLLTNAINKNHRISIINKYFNFNSKGLSEIRLINNIIFIKTYDIYVKDLIKTLKELNESLKGTIINNKDDMKKVLKSLDEIKYTLAYNSPLDLSEDEYK